jgi:hypothetical protein
MLWGMGIVGIASKSFAESPSVTRIFPAGGQRGTSLTVETKGKFPNPNVRVWSDRPGLTWERIPDTGNFTVHVAADAEPGLHFVRFHDELGATSLHRFIVGTLPEVNEVEPNNQPTQAAVAANLPLVFNGVLQERADVDMFRVALRQGQTLVATIESNRQLLSPVDMVMQLTDAKGIVLAANHDYHDLDPLLTWTAPYDQEVMLRLFGFPASPDSTIGFSGAENYIYRLTVTTGPYWEATLPLAVSSMQDAAIQPAGWNLDASLEQSAVLVVPQQRLQELHQRGESLQVFSENVAGLISLPVVDGLVMHEQQTDWDKDGDLVLPAIITGSISAPREQDGFWFAAEKGVVYELKLVSRQLGYPLDAFLSIESTEGKSLATQDDVGSQADPTLRFTAPESARFRVVVRDVNDWGSPHAFYRLHIGPEEKQVRLTHANDLVVGKVGETLELVVKIERIAGFDLPIEFVCPEAPPAIAFNATTSEPTGDSAREVKLKVDLSAPISSPLRIVGRIAHGETTEDVSILTENAQLDSVWIVAEPKPAE